MIKSDMPLSILCGKLITGPPNVNSMLDVVYNAQFMARFTQMVTMYLPGHAKEINKGPSADRMEAFGRLFSEEYFPLSDGGLSNMDLEYFLDHMPAEQMGIGYEEYHDFASFRDGWSMMLTMAGSPWEDPEDTEDPRCHIGRLSGMPTDQGRGAIMDWASNLLPKELVVKIPHAGWDVGELQLMLDGTSHAAVAQCAAWLNHETGYYQLDTDMEDEEGLVWSKDTVRQLKGEWPKVKELMEAVAKYSEWLEEDTKPNTTNRYAHFAEMVRFVLGRTHLLVTKNQTRLPLDEKAQVVGRRLYEVLAEEVSAQQVPVRLVVNL